MLIDKPHAVIVQLALSRGWVPDAEAEDGVIAEGATIGAELTVEGSKYWEHLPYGESTTVDDQYRVVLYAAAEQAIKWFRARGDIPAKRTS